jgi:hypothetical protein
MNRQQKLDIDELAEVRAQLKPLQEREEQLKETLKILGFGVFRGLKYFAIIEKGTNSGFDSKALKAALPEAIWGPYWRKTPYIKVSVKPATVQTQQVA